MVSSQNILQQKPNLKQGEKGIVSHQIKLQNHNCKVEINKLA